MRAFLWLAFFGLAAAVVWLTLQPGPGGVAFTLWDKIQHFGAYGALAGLAGLAARNWREAALYAALLTLAGYLLEIAQTYVGRSYDLYDAAANALGCLAGFAVSQMILRLIRR